MSLVELESPSAAAEWCREQRTAGKSIGFIPTMGALHAGHLSLVERALEENDLVAVSVFVNPLQFDEASDLAHYPRDWSGDVAQLAGVGAHMVFTGTLEQFFAGELDREGRLDEGRLVAAGAGALGLEGACRHGHFDGVATIVDRLFDVVGPNRAYFGQKDFQQCLVVEEVARRRGAPEVVVCPISREASGLARSSRNERLSAADRERAACLSRSLSQAAHLWQDGERDASKLESVMRLELESAGVDIEYAAVRERRSWSAQACVGELRDAVALVAARLGEVRLIDNHILSECAPQEREALASPIPGRERPA